MLLCTEHGDLTINAVPLINHKNLRCILTLAVWGANGWKPLTLTQTRCWQHPQFYSKWNGGKKPTTWAAFTMKLYVYNNVLLLGHRSAVSQGVGKWNQLWIVRNSLGTEKKKKKKIWRVDRRLFSLMCQVLDL